MPTLGQRKRFCIAKYSSYSVFVWAGVFVCICVCACRCCYLYASSFVYGSRSQHRWSGKAIIWEPGVKIEQLVCLVLVWRQTCGLVCVCAVMRQGANLGTHTPVNVSPVSNVWDHTPSDQLQACCSDTCTSGMGIVNQTLVFLSSHLQVAPWPCLRLKSVEWHTARALVVPC